MTHDTRTCATCDTTKPTSDFYKDRSRSRGYDRHCKDCSKARTAERYRKRTGSKTEYAPRGSVPRIVDTKRICPECGREFTWDKNKSTYCSRSCGGKAGGRMVAERNRKRGLAPRRKRDRPAWQMEIRKCEWCEELFFNNRMQQLTCSTECAKKRRHSRDINKAHKRREYIKSVTIEPVKVMQVYERDNWTCGICGDPIDPSLKWPNPKSVSLDHIIPISKGGEHSMKNTRASHLGCNIGRGNCFDSTVEEKGSGSNC